MKIYLASFLQPERHGPGRRISISFSKPENFTVSAVWEPVIPSNTMMENYRKTQLEDQSRAAEDFNTSYKMQLTSFFSEAKAASEEENLSVQEILPLRDGDTLLCWEREGYTSYRVTLADYLRDLGYSVELR